MAIVDDVGAMRQCRGGTEILFDQDNGLSAVGQIAAG